MKKWILLLNILITNNVYSAEIAGICGDSYDDCHYTLSNDGILTISGNGKMSDYDIEGGYTMPWGNQIKAVQMSGITSIGTYAFYNTPGLTNVTIPKTVENINEGAFAMTSLNDVIYETDETGQAKLKTIGRDVFAMTNIKNMVIPNSVTEIGQGVFYRDKKLESIVIGDLVSSLGIYLLAEASNDAVIYCQDTQQRTCRDLIEENNVGNAYRLKSYSFDKDGNIISENKKFSSLDKLAKGLEIKRIYTIDEANAVAGKVNSVKIRYR